MLDFSISEIGLIGVVALVAIGPERLPKVARAAGVLLGRFRRYAQSVKADIDREIQQAELKELQKKIEQSAREAQQSLANTTREAELAVTVASDETRTILGTPVMPEPAAASTDVPAVAPAEAQVAEPLPPFGGDPFSVRPAAPLRSKPMTPPSTAERP